MLAGMDESPGETIVYEGRRYKSYRGMGSLAAMKEGGGERYFQQEKDELKLLPPLFVKAFVLGIPNDSVTSSSSTTGSLNW